MCTEKPAQVEEDANAGEWCTSRQKRSRSRKHKAGAGEVADEKMKKAIQDVIEMPTPLSKKNEKKSRGQSKMARRSGAVEEVPFGEMLWGNAISLTEEMQKKCTEESPKKTAQVEEDANAGEWSTAGQRRARSKVTR